MLQHLQRILKYEITCVRLESGSGLAAYQVAMAGAAGGAVRKKGRLPLNLPQMSASGPGLLHISVNDPKKQKSNVELCERGRAEWVSIELEVLGVKKREMGEIQEQQK